MNYQSILSRFKYNDGKHISDRISKASPTNYREQLDIINEIVLWKINRIPYVEEELIDMIYSLSTLTSPLDAVNNPSSFFVIMGLLNCKGIQLPMASTILHFYYPDIFPIIDQRAYRELYNRDYPPVWTKDDKLAHIYLQYITDCVAYHQRNCSDIPFSQIDKILYQLDKEKGNRVNY